MFCKPFCTPLSHIRFTICSIIFGVFPVIFFTWHITLSKMLGVNYLKRVERSLGRLFALHPLLEKSWGLPFSLNDFLHQFTPTFSAAMPFPIPRTLPATCRANINFFKARQLMHPYRGLKKGDGGSCSNMLRLGILKKPVFPCFAVSVLSYLMCS